MTDKFERIRRMKALRLQKSKQESHKLRKEVERISNIVKHYKV